jgi:UDP-glucose 4-epimerase/GDP-4-dehydro-6-deoxy-D-mannose reductase
MHSFDYFFHFAAIVPVSDVENNPLEAYEVNAIGSYYICKEIIKIQKPCWLFIASTSHVYKKQSADRTVPLKESNQKKPPTIYGMTKLLAEQISIPILKQYKIPYCIGRIFSFTSEIQKEPYLVPTLRRKIEATPEKGTLNIVNPDCIRDIVDAETVVDCILHLAYSHFKGIVNIGSGEGKRIIDIAHYLMKSANKNIQIKGVNETEPDSLVADVTLLRKVLLK